MIIPEKLKTDLRNLAFNFFRDEPAYNPYLNAMEKIFSEHQNPELINQDALKGGKE